MVLESSVHVVIDFASLPLLPGAYELAHDGVVPGGSRRNLADGLQFLDPGPYDEIHQLIAADAQTSGGLVFGVDPTETDAVLAELRSTGHRPARIGVATSAAPGLTLR